MLFKGEKNMTYEDGLEIIENLKKSYLIPSHVGISVKDYMYKMYAREAIEAVEDYVKKHRKNGSIIDVVEEFRYFADGFACSARKPKQNFAWSIAYDVASDVLDNLLL